MLLELWAECGCSAWRAAGLQCWCMLAGCCWRCCDRGPKVPPGSVLAIPCDLVASVLQVACGGILVLLGADCAIW